MSDKQDKSNRVSLSRRKALAGIGTIGAAAALGGVGTFAQFTDTEETQIDFTAGGIDGTLQAHATYNGEEVFGLQPVGDGEPAVVASFDDIKPGDFGSITFEIEVQNNPAWVASCIGYQNDIDAESFEPEIEADPNVTDVTPSLTNHPYGELANNILLLPFYDPTDNYFFDGGIPSSPITPSDYGSGTAGTFWELANPVGEHDGTFNPLTIHNASIVNGAKASIIWEEQETYTNNAPEGTSVEPGCTVLNGALAGSEGVTNDNHDQSMNPLEPGTPLSYGLDWHLPFTTGNEAQGDSVELLLGFDFVQTRHSDGPEFQNTYNPGNFTGN